MAERIQAAALDPKFIEQRSQIPLPQAVDEVLFHVSCSPLKRCLPLGSSLVTNCELKRLS
jgi:hypothetical protein